jgi:hypothetical protein
MDCNCDPLTLFTGLLALLGLLAATFLILGLIADYLLPELLDHDHD